MDQVIFTCVSVSFTLTPSDLRLLRVLWRHSLVSCPLCWCERISTTDLKYWKCHGMILVSRDQGCSVVCFISHLWNSRVGSYETRDSVTELSPHNSVMFKGNRYLDPPILDVQRHFRVKSQHPNSQPPHTNCVFRIHFFLVKNDFFVKQTINTLKRE
jgi:hypothetical protein